jgi:hypothetical protein
MPQIRSLDLSPLRVHVCHLQLCWKHWIGLKPSKYAWNCWNTRFYEEDLVRVSRPGRRSETSWQPREPPQCSGGGQQQPALRSLACVRVESSSQAVQRVQRRSAALLSVAWCPVSGSLCDFGRCRPADGVQRTRGDIIYTLGLTYAKFRIVLSKVLCGLRQSR